MEDEDPEEVEPITVKEEHIPRKKIPRSGKLKRMSQRL